MKKLKFNLTMKNLTRGVLTLLAIILFQSNIHGQQLYEGKVIMAVFAHPDDEGTVAPILAKYIRGGATAHLVIVTDGRYGTNDHHDHVAGETLVATRKEEMKCAAEKLGVILHHWDYHDQLRAGEGYDGHVPHARKMIQQLYDLVESVKPDVLITWGPDGASTHMDHRLVGATVTQVFLAKDWGEKPGSLYYYGTPTELIEDSTSKILRGQAKKFLRTKISYTQEDLDKSFNSIKCHYSQMPPNMKKEDYEKRRASNGMYVYLRKFEGPTKDSNSIFD
ncbi:PIG-L deacetylase family protein [Flagellimonas sp.]|uniref:PIG-L deacetylase family protein n=1 Tax=Flagellimonas sp. TaxID=2058762 RepID=UPI003BA99513